MLIAGTGGLCCLQILTQSGPAESYDSLTKVILWIVGLQVAMGLGAIIGGVSALRRDRKERQREDREPRE